MYVVDSSLIISDHELLRAMELNSLQLLKLLEAQTTHFTCKSLYLDAISLHKSWKMKNDLR